MNILDLARDCGLHPVLAAAGEYKSACPGCGGKDRFRLWPDEGSDNQGRYYCRACQRAGDRIQFLRDFKGRSYPEACRELGRDPGQAPARRLFPTPRHATPATYLPRDVATPLPAWQEKALALVDWAHGLLLKNGRELEYLAGRGIPLDAARAFRLGWNPGESGQDIYRPRPSFGLPEVAKPDGKPKRLWMPRGLVIPFFWRGQIQRLRFRRPKEHLRSADDSKYVVLPGSAMGPMLTRESARAWCIVEAELDAIAVDAAAGDVCGGMGLGSLSTRPDARAHARATAALRLLNALDYEPAAPAASDEEQRKAALKAQARGWWERAYPQARRWPVPAGKDPGEAYALGEDLRAWIIAGLPPGLNPDLVLSPGPVSIGAGSVGTIGPSLSAGSVGGAGAASMDARVGNADQSDIDRVTPDPSPAKSPEPPTKNPAPIVPPRPLLRPGESPVTALRSLLLDHPVEVVLAVDRGRPVGWQGPWEIVKRAMALTEIPEAAAWLADLASALAQEQPGTTVVSVTAAEVRKPRGGER